MAKFGVTLVATWRTKNINKTWKQCCGSEIIFSDPAPAPTLQGISDPAPDPISDPA